MAIVVAAAGLGRGALAKGSGRPPDASPSWSGLGEPAADLGPGEAEEQQRREQGDDQRANGCAGEEQRAGSPGS